MAKALRSKSTNVFVWILLLLLIVGLAGFGAGSFGGSFSTVGSVGDEKVTLKTYIRLYRAFKGLYRAISYRYAFPILSLLALSIADF